MAYDGSFLYALVKTNPEIREIEKHKSRPLVQVCDIYLDSDNNQNTGGTSTAPGSVVKGIDCELHIGMTMYVNGPRVRTSPSYNIREQGNGICKVDENGFYQGLVQRAMIEETQRVITLQGPYLEIKIPISVIGVQPNTDITLYLKEWETDLFTKLQAFVPPQAKPGGIEAIVASGY